MKQYDIGIDLGTTSIIIATEEQGVVFRQPTIGAVDTRTNSILAVGDEALSPENGGPRARPYRPGTPFTGWHHPGSPHDERIDRAVRQ